MTAPTCTARRASCGSVRMSTAPVCSPRRRSSAPAPRSPTTPRSSAALACSASAWSQPVRRATPRNRGDFVDMVRATLGVEPEVVTGDRGSRAVLRRRGGHAARAERSGAARRPRRRIDRTRPRIAGGAWRLARAQHGRRLGAHDRAASARRPTDGGADRGRRRRRDSVVGSTPRRDVPLHEAHTIVGVAGTITTLAAIVLGLDALRRRASSTAPAYCRAARRRHRPAGARKPCRARRDHGHPSRTGRRDHCWRDRPAHDRRAHRYRRGYCLRTRHPGRDRPLDRVI